MLNKKIEERSEEEGASLVEYGLLVALIAVVAIAAVTLLGTNTSDKIECAARTIGDLGGCAPGGTAPST